MNQSLRTLLLLSLAPALVSVALPASAASPGEATVVFFGPGIPSYCKSRPGPALEVAERGGYRAATVPAGARITILNRMRINDATIPELLSYMNCVPGIAFTPEAGATYYVQSRNSHKQCVIELVRDDKSRATGVALEPSVALRECDD